MVTMYVLTCPFIKKRFVACDLGVLSPGVSTLQAGGHTSLFTDQMPFPAVVIANCGECLCFGFIIRNGQRKNKLESDKRWLVSECSYILSILNCKNCSFACFLMGVKLGLSHWGKAYIEGVSKQGPEECYIMISFIIYTVRQILLAW